MTRYMVVDSWGFPITVMEERVAKVLILSEWKEVEDILKKHDEWGYHEITENSKYADFADTL